MYTTEEIAQDVHNRYKIWDMDEGTNYAQSYSYDKILAIVRNSIEKIDEKNNFISQDNKQKILQTFGVVKRKKSKSIRYKIESEDLYIINTDSIKKNSLGVGALRRENSIFFDAYSLKNGEEEDKKLLKDLLDDETLPRYALQEVENTFNYKTPLNITLASHKPERDFIKKLVKDENIKALDSWIKSLDVGFYSIKYSWRKGEHPKQGSFNPDFFIKLGKDILVIEIKADNDVSKENKAKLKYAKEHFKRLNKLQSDFNYYFKFLSPSNYDLFFQVLREGKYKTFKSKIEAELGEPD